MPDRLVVLCDDLLFWARIRAAAEAAGRPVARVTDAASLESVLAEGGIRKVLADLDTRSVDVLAAGARFKALDDPPVLVAFGSHVNERLLESAKAAGYDEAIPNSVLSRRLLEGTAI